MPTDLQDEPEILGAEEGGSPVIIGEVRVLPIHGQDMLLDSPGKQFQLYFAQGHMQGHLQEYPEPLQPQPWLKQPHLGTARAGSGADGQRRSSWATVGGAEQRCRVEVASAGQEEATRTEGVCLPVNGMENSLPGASKICSNYYHS